MFELLLIKTLNVTSYGCRDSSIVGMISSRWHCHRDGVIVGSTVTCWIGVEGGNNDVE